MCVNFKTAAEEMINKITQSTSVYIASHIYPDGDSIGSLVALGTALQQIFNDKIVMLTVDDVPYQLDFLVDGVSLKKPDTSLDIDTLITLDCSDLDRLGPYKFLGEKANSIINIDHHVTNTSYGNINIVDPKASSTGEIIFRIIETLDLNINEIIATNIYSAISTDTGSFKYDATSSVTHRIAANLIDLGVNLNHVNINLYQNRSLNRTKLFIEALKGHELHFDNKVAIVTIDQEILHACQATLSDADDIVEFIRDTNTVEIACLLKEIQNNETKVSLRSKNKVNVAEIASKFNGGGHQKASGCTIKSNINTSKDILLKEIQTFIG